MKVLLLGAKGMLGHQICRILSSRMEVWGAVRETSDEFAHFNILPRGRVIGQLDILDIAKVENVLDYVKPNIVINSIGIVKQRDEAKQAILSIQVNALFPHQLAELCVERNIRLIHISTDCVFSGFRGKYSEIDIPDPVDLYGRTKLLGELNRPDCLTLRTSIIGWQISSFTGLISWFALQRGKHIKGYNRAIYTGLSTQVLANLIGDILQTRPELSGIYQVASEPISKYDLLVRFRDILGWRDINIELEDQFFCDRSLSGARFGNTTGWQSPNWQTMLENLADEYQFYSKYYTQ